MKDTFPGRKITKMYVTYGAEEKRQVREQVLADRGCPEIFLKNCQIICFLGPPPPTNEDGFLNPQCFNLSGSEIAAIRMRMYAQQKLEAQEQLGAGEACFKVMLNTTVECRLKRKE